MIDVKTVAKRAGIAGLIAFVALHVLVFGGAAAYGLHLAGLDVPFLDHHHECITPKETP